MGVINKMKKLGIISIILGLLLVFSVFGQPILDLVITDPANSNPGTSVSSTFNITNSGDEDATNVVFSIPEDLDGPIAYTIPLSAVVFSENNIDLSFGEEKEITYTINIPNQQYAGSYTGTIEVGSDQTVATEDTFTFNVNQVVGIEITSGLDSNNIFLMSGSEDSVISKTFTLSNTGNADLTNMQFTLTEEQPGSFSDGDKILSFKVNGNSISFGSAFNLGTMSIGANTITIEATIPSNIDVDTYEGNVTLQSTTFPNANESFFLNVMVGPEICSDGLIGNLDVKINEPDDGDDFKQGQEISVDVTVDNNDNSDDLDIIVEAILYDLDDDQEITSVESDAVEIESGDDKDFDLTLTIPYDEDLEEDHTYYLYVKAYEEGNEEDHCDYISNELDFKRDSHAVIVDGFSINPSVVNNGQLVNFIVDVSNIGENDEEDVYIKVYNSELGLDEESTPFDLDKYKDSNNDETKTISFTIPTTATAKDYAIEAIVYYDDGDESYSTFGTLTVNGYGNTAGTSDGTSILSLPQTTISATAGNVFSIPFTINNNGASSATYVISVTANGGWAEGVTETMTVEAGSSNTGYAYLTPSSSTTSGSYTATVTLSQDGSEIGSSIVNVNIGGAGTGATGAVTYQPASILSDLTGSTWFWIIGNIVLVVLVILILFLIFRKR